MGFFNNNPWNSSDGGGVSPVQPTDLTKIFEYTEQGTTVDQQYWKIRHPNFRRDIDKALIYLNGTLIDEATWSIVTMEDGDYAYIPLGDVTLQTIPPYLHVIVFVNGFGN